MIASPRCGVGIIEGENTRSLLFGRLHQFDGSISALAQLSLNRLVGVRVQVECECKRAMCVILQKGGRDFTDRILQRYTKLLRATTVAQSRQLEC